MLTGGPFDDILKVVSEQKSRALCDEDLISKHLNTKGLSPDTGLGELYYWLANSQATSQPNVAQAHVCILASSYKGTDASDIVLKFVTKASSGQVAVNQLCADLGIGLRVLEMAPQIPHQIGQSWSELDCTKAVAFGMEAGAAGGDVLAISDIAPGNDAGKLALIASCVEDGEDWLNALAIEGHETAQSATVMLEKYSGFLQNPLEALRILGGREVAGNLGAFIAGRSQNLAIVIDGWSAIAAYAVLEKIKLGAGQHIRLGACENALQKCAADKLKFVPLVGHFIDAGPGCGGALSVSVLKAAVDVAL